MIIQIDNDTMTFENDPSLVNTILQTIEEQCYIKGFRISHFLIDDIPVFENISDYLLNNIKNIELLKVVSLDKSAVIIETLIMERDYIKMALPQISVLADEFYKQPDEKSWSKLEDLFEAVQWIIEALKKIDSFKDLNTVISDYETWNKYVQSVKELIPLVKEMDEVLSKKDLVALGDLLLYELEPLFKGNLEKLECLLIGLEGNCVS